MTTFDRSITKNSIEKKMVSEKKKSCPKSKISKK